MHDYTCVLCGFEFFGYGNNAEPISEGESCDDCNNLVLIDRLILANSDDSDD